MSFSLTLRPATFSDEKIILDWRNDPTVLAVLPNPAPVSDESHRAWLLRAMTDNETRLFIAELAGLPIGQGRIERAWKAISPKMDACFLGYSIAKEYRGAGYGKQLVSLLVKEAQALGYPTISCRIKRDNLRSVVVALAAGVNAIEVF